MMELQAINFGVLLILVGIFLVILGGILIFLQEKQTKVEGGICIGFTKIMIFHL
jgi:uncharacterized membrane protein